MTSHRHILTINLEDYFQVGPLRSVIPQRYWPRFESRVEQNTAAALDLLDEVGATATFFTIGWIADHMSDVVAEVARRGHEVASKGYFHRALSEMSPEEFRADVVRSRLAIERASGQAVRGYRIARGWFSEDDLWALDILAEEGFDYDSSLRPLGRSVAGDSDRWVLHRHRTGDHEIWEAPISSWKFCGYSLPISGGNFTRQLPEGFMRRRVAQWDKQQRAPLVFYFHVWELDPDQPRVTAVPYLERVRQYRNLEHMPERVRHYLDEYRFTSLCDYLKLPMTPAPERAAADQKTIDAAQDAAWNPADRQAVSVVVPCFNEEPTLAYLANTLERFIKEYERLYKFTFVFVDDGSSDATWSRLNELFGARDDCVLVQHKQNRGVAAATLTGIHHAPDEIVASIDCDCSYDPNHLTVMIPLLTEGIDLVTASPYHSDGAVAHVPGWRLFLSKGLSRLYRLVLHHKFSTYTSCCRIYRRSAMTNLHIKNDGYFGIAEILARMDMNGAKMVESPAILESRILGQSKMKVVMTIVGHLKLLASLVSERAQGCRVESLQSGEQG